MGRTSDANIRLMDAALDLIWGESFGAVTIDDICNRAEVKKGSFYYFFNSKSELAIAALERLWNEDSKPKMDGLFSPTVEPLTRITSYMRFVYEAQDEIRTKYGKVLGCPVVSVGSETCACAEGTAIGAKMREMFSRKRSYYESAIRDALAEGSIEPCDPAEKGLALAALLEGTLTQARILNDLTVLKSLPDLSLRVLGAKQTAAVKS